MLHDWIFKPCLITMKFEMIENLFVQVEQRKYLVALTKIQLHDKLHEKDQFEIDHAWMLCVQFLVSLFCLCNKQSSHCLHYYPKTKQMIDTTSLLSLWIWMNPPSEASPTRVKAVKHVPQIQYFSGITSLARSNFFQFWIMFVNQSVH